MRSLALLLLVLIAPGLLGAAPAFPPLTGRVVDAARLLGDDTRTQMERRLADYENGTGHQLVVVTVPGLGDTPIEDYGYRLGRHWGLGQKGKDNGALLIIAPQERQARIEVGYGLEGDLTDAQSRLIIEHMVPFLQTGNYDAAVALAVREMMAALGGESMPSPAAPATTQESGGFALLLPLLLIFLVLRSFGQRRSGLLAPLVLGSMLGSGGRRNWGGNGFGGFRGGGGSFGGGGATGRW